MIPLLGIYEKEYKRRIIEVYNYPYQECTHCKMQTEYFGDHFIAERYAKEMFNQYGMTYINFESCDKPRPVTINDLFSLNNPP